MKRKMTYVSKVIAAALTLAMMLSSVSFAAGGDGYPTNGGPTANVWDYDYGNSASPVKGYLAAEANGNLTRVEYDQGRQVVTVSSYTADFAHISSKEISAELPKWGGFYSGPDYNFLVFGKDNTAESNANEVIRIVKYSKSFERLGALSIYGENTESPFRAGGLSMVQVGDILFIHTAHRMYKSSDGLNHQANMLFKVKVSNMTLIASRTGVSQSSGYVSHSFNQFIDSDGTYFYCVDHGDAYPRSVYVTRQGIDKPITGWVDVDMRVNAYRIDGSTGNNITGVNVGGMALSGNNILVPICSVPMTGSNTTTPRGYRNAILLVIPKTGGESNVKKIALTNYTQAQAIDCTPPRITKVNNNCFMVGWIETSGSGRNSVKVNKFLLVDGEGKAITQVVTSNAAVTEVQPITKGSTVIWYSGRTTRPVFYKVDCSSPAAFYNSFATTVYNGVDYSSVYNYADYTAMNPDVAAAYGSDFVGILGHFVKYGMAEGRQASKNFSYQSYFNEYPDVRMLYGENKAGYYQHYMTIGMAQGRHGTGCLTKIPGPDDIFQDAPIDGIRHRFYNPATGDHVFLATKYEGLIAGYLDDHVTVAVATSGDPVYSLWNSVTRDHVYTTDKAYGEYVVSLGYGYEFDYGGNAAFFSGGSTPVYSFCVPNKPQHLYSASIEEGLAAGYQVEMNGSTNGVPNPVFYFK